MNIINQTLGHESGWFAREWSKELIINDIAHLRAYIKICAIVNKMKRRIKQVILKNTILDSMGIAVTMAACLKLVTATSNIQIVPLGGILFVSYYTGIIFKFNEMTVL